MESKQIKTEIQVVDQPVPSSLETVRKSNLPIKSYESDDGNAISNPNSVNVDSLDQSNNFFDRGSLNIADDSTENWCCLCGSLWICFGVSEAVCEVGLCLCELFLACV